MTQPPAAPFPRQIKHYELRRLLGQGGMGLVLEGTDRRDGTRVAVKLLYPHLAASDPTFLDRFEREAHVAALLRSPYTVHLLDYGVENDQSFLVMEFIDGQPLSTLVGRGALEPDDALRVAGEVARALEEANARGVVHRDIKPENVLIDSRGRVKVTDFGIARSTTAPGITQTGGFVGTPAFAAPEQIDGNVDHRSDIYALGVTLYTMLTGRPPYRGKTAMDTLFQHRSAPLPSEPIAHLPDTVQNLVRRCLEKDPLDRYQTASELVGALDRARQVLARTPAGSPTNVETIALPATPSTGLTGPPRRDPPPPSPLDGPTQAAPGASWDAPAATAVAPTDAPPPVTAPAPPVTPRERDDRPRRRGVLYAAIGAALVAAGVVVALVLLLGGGDDPPPVSPSETPTATQSATQAQTATQSPSATNTATTTPTEEALPSVTAAVPGSRLQSGSGAIVTGEGVSVVVLRNPSESSDDNEVFAQLFSGEGVVVVTNSPAASTVNVTEGLVFWRVLIPGTGVTGWVKEMHADGSLRFLDPARSHKVEEGETCETIAGDNGVVLEDLLFVNQFDDAICADLPVGNLIVLPN